MRDLRFTIADTLRTFKTKARLIHRDSWQGLDIKTKPEMATFEIIGHSLIADLNGRGIAYYEKQVAPDLPWVKDHFAERVSGQPLNPPPSEEWWPHAVSNATFKKEGIFSHTYPERFWPKLAGSAATPRRGIRYPYGDLGDVVELLRREPLTRQAYLPVWGFEDTGNVMHERTPCTLGYLFLREENKLNLFYFIRSCDLLRHFRNDIMLAIMLLLWVLDQLGEPWCHVMPGKFYMTIGSLHAFRNDWVKLFGEHR